MATVKCPLREAGFISRNQPVLIGRDLEILYGELDLIVTATAHDLLRSGIQKGDRVALFMENGFHSIVLLLSLFRMGAVACPLSTRLPIQGVREHLEWIACDQLIARVGETARRDLSGITCYDPESLVATTITLPGQHEDIRIPLGQPATLFFTSGSAGHPKAVLHSFGNHYYSSFGANSNVRVRSGDRWLLSLPLYHVGGMAILFRCLTSGAGIVLPEHGQSLEDALREHRVTHLSLVTTQMQRLLEANIPDETVSKLKAVILGGSEIPNVLLDRARARHWPVLPTYGLTEMASQVTAVSPLDPSPEHHGSGSLLKHRELSLADDGEILVRGQTLFLGYVVGSDLHRPLDRDGWFATGDIGHMDENGFLTVIGRKDNLFISGGENIQPEEIERALLEIPELRRAVVVPIADHEYGRRPVAFVEAGQETPDEERLREALRKRLPAFKIPVIFYPWPKTKPAGIKISREALRKQAEEMHAGE